MPLGGKVGVSAALPRVSTRSTGISQLKQGISHRATHFISCLDSRPRHLRRYETSGERGPVASTEDLANLWRKHRRRQDHLLHRAVSSFSKEAAASAVYEASVYWTLGRSR
jgi:hypothetical protein